MNRFDERVRAMAQEEIKKTEIPEDFTRDMNALLENLPERDVRETYGWQRKWSYGFTAAMAVFALMFAMPLLRTMNTSMAASTAGGADRLNMEVNGNACLDTAAEYAMEPDSIFLADSDYRAVIEEKCERSFEDCTLITFNDDRTMVVWFGEEFREIPYEEIEPYLLPEVIEGMN